MAPKSWMKLYTEILRDPKMGRLSDRLFRRVIEIFLIAREYGEAGELPPVTDMAWMLRADEKELESELAALAGVEILSQDEEGNLYVTHFDERQAADTSTERVRRHRGVSDMKRNVSKPFQDGNANETEVKRNETHLRGEESREDSESEREGEGEQISAREGKTDKNDSFAREQSENGEGEDQFDLIQRACEEVIGLPVTPGDIPPIQGMVEIGATRADIRAAADWMAANQKTIRYVGQLFGPVRTAVAKRKQEALGRDGPAGAERKNGRRHAADVDSDSPEFRRRYVLPADLQQDEVEEG